MESLGRRLRHFRIESGWSKRMVAGKLGVSIPSIIRWEEEIAQPNDYNCYKIERFLTEGVASPVSASREIHQLGLFPEEGAGKAR